MPPIIGLIVVIGLIVAAKKGVEAASDELSKLWARSNSDHHKALKARHPDMSDRTAARIARGRAISDAAHWGPNVTRGFRRGWSDARHEQRQYKGDHQQWLTNHRARVKAAKAGAKSKPTVAAGPAGTTTTTTTGGGSGSAGPGSGTASGSPNPVGGTAAGTPGPTAPNPTAPNPTAPNPTAPNPTAPNPTAPNGTPGGTAPNQPGPQNSSGGLFECRNCSSTRAPIPNGLCDVCSAAGQPNNGNGVNVNSANGHTSPAGGNSASGTSGTAANGGVMVSTDAPVEANSYEATERALDAIIGKAREMMNWVDNQSAQMASMGVDSGTLGAVARITQACQNVEAAGLEAKRVHAGNLGGVKEAADNAPVNKLPEMEYMTGGR